MSLRALHALALPGWMAALAAGMVLALVVGTAAASEGVAPSSAAADLGGRLFADPRLSPDGRFSCASCHRPTAAFAEPGVARQRGRDGALLPVNTPSLIGLDRRGPFRHDGAAATLEAQIAVPLLARNEMANPSLEALAQRLAADARIVADFVQVYGRPPTGGDIVAALSAFVRSLASEDTPFDRWSQGDPSALSQSAGRGAALFRGKAGCAACHLADGERPGFRDGRFHDTGIAARRARRPFADGVRPTEGRIAVTGRPADRYRVRTPGLRGVAATPPYMHDGSIRTLEAVVRYYAAGGAPHAGLSPLIAPFAVEAGEVADLVAFLEALGSGAAPPAGMSAVTGAPAE